MADKISSFDAQIQADTAKKLVDLRAQMEVDMQAKLSKQKSDAEGDLTGRWRTVMLPITQEYAQVLFPNYDRGERMNRLSLQRYYMPPKVKSMLEQASFEDKLREMAALRKCS